MIDYWFLEKCICFFVLPGIEFCDKLEDIMKYIENPTQQGTYVVQKYIGKFSYCIYRVLSVMLYVVSIKCLLIS